MEHAKPDQDATRQFGLLPSDNDVFKKSFQSHIDPYFTRAVKEDNRIRRERWRQEAARSALATTRPIK